MISVSVFIPKTRFYDVNNVNEGDQVGKWLGMMTDPSMEIIRGEPNLEKIIHFYPRPKGEPAFDPLEIHERIKTLKTYPEINTGHSLLDLSIKTGLVHIDATFEGDHPKYGRGTYAGKIHDGFPPTIIAAVDALSLWGMNDRASALFRYWLGNFVRVDGSISYYGPSIAEYGQLLHTAYILYDRAGKSTWWDTGFPALEHIIDFLIQLYKYSSKDDGLLAGVPEADTRSTTGKYFHNNAWVVKGLKQWVKLCQITGAGTGKRLDSVNDISNRLKKDTLEAIKNSWSRDVGSWWLPGLKDSTANPSRLTDGEEANYTNYRYWLELLSSGILPGGMANRIVDARLHGGGQFCGTTRFQDGLDDWPLVNYLYSLWRLRRKNDFLLSLFGHICYHQCEGHLTAFEQFYLPGDKRGSKKADYCLPSQLVAARAGRLINRT